MREIYIIITIVCILLLCVIYKGWFKVFGTIALLLPFMAFPVVLFNTLGHPNPIISVIVPTAMLCALMICCKIMRNHRKERREILIGLVLSIPVVGIFVLFCQQLPEVVAEFFAGISVMVVLLQFWDRNRTIDVKKTGCTPKIKVLNETEILDKIHEFYETARKFEKSCRAYEESQKRKLKRAISECDYEMALKIVSNHDVESEITNSINDIERIATALFDIRSKTKWLHNKETAFDYTIKDVTEKQQECRDLLEVTLKKGIPVYPVLDSEYYTRVLFDWYMKDEENYMQRLSSPVSGLEAIYSSGAHKEDPVKYQIIFKILLSTQDLRWKLYELIQITKSYEILPDSLP